MRDRHHSARHARHAAWNNVVIDNRSIDRASVPFVAQTLAELTAEAVRIELARRRISGRNMARSLGWSYTTTARRLNGEYPMNIDELAAVAGFFGIPMAELLPTDVAA